MKEFKDFWDIFRYFIPGYVKRDSSEKKKESCKSCFFIFSDSKRSWLKTASLTSDSTSFDSYQPESEQCNSLEDFIDIFLKF